MTDHRLWIALLLAGWLASGGLARAQDSTGGTSGAGGGAPASGTGAASSFGAGPGGGGSPGGAPLLPFGTPGTPTPFTPPGNSLFGTPPNQGGTTSFGTPQPQGNSTTPGTPDNTAPGGTGNGTGTGAGTGNGNGAGPTPPPIPNENEAPPSPGNSGAASAFGTGFTGGVTPPPQALPTTFTMPAAYGQSPQTFSAGVGHLSKPRFHYSLSMQVGFDDNVEATPTASTARPAVTERVEVSPAVAPFTLTLALPPPPQTSIVLGAPPPPQQFRTITIPGKPEGFKTETLSPAVPAQPRIESFVLRTNAAMDVEFATHRTYFTMSVNGGVDSYQNRPGGNIDPTGGLSLSFVHRITPRLEFTASVNATYTSQPSVQTINTAAGELGSYLNVGSKYDLSYRWSPRFSTVTSFSLLGQEYESAIEKVNNNYDTVFGTEFRYLWSPRLTLLTEVRYDFKTYSSDAPRDSRTIYLLLGGEMALSSRFSTSVRFGESEDSFANSSGQASTPYAETTVTWRYCPTGFLSWNTRYGFEDPPDANSTVKGVHTGLSVLQALSKKLRLSGGLTYVTRTTVTGLIPVNSTAVAGSSSTEQDTVDLSLGVEYTLSPHVILSASYTYDNVLNTGGIDNYYHNRMFFGFTYSF